MLTAVIPTRNRPVDLRKAVASIITQTRLPDELIIVDQSPGDESKVIVHDLVVGWPGLTLNYIHDTSIIGLVDAKRVAVERAMGAIVCFLEDDVVLEDDYLEQIEYGFAERPEMIGCCGIVTNPPPQAKYYEALFNLFHRGLYHDIRVGIYGRQATLGEEMIPSSVLSGGLSAWRREVFPVVKFDVANDFHMYEDMDFSTRVARYFGDRLYINPRARLAHYASPVNREILGLRQQRKLRECITYYKKRRTWPWAFPSLAWLLLGLLLEATHQSLSVRSTGPLRGFLAGLRDGIAKDVVVVDF